MRVLTRNGAYEVFNARLHLSSNLSFSSRSSMKDEELRWEVRFRDKWQELSVLVSNREEGYDLIEEVYESGYCDLTQFKNVRIYDFEMNEWFGE